MAGTRFPGARPTESRGAGDLIAAIRRAVVAECRPACLYTCVSGSQFLSLAISESCVVLSHKRIGARPVSSLANPLSTRRESSFPGQHLLPIETAYATWLPAPRNAH